MHIDFNPPLGGSVHIATSSLSFRHTQTTPLLFTAQLSAHDHKQLVQDGGRVQLWSDIPQEGSSSHDAWGELDFADSRELGSSTSSHKISLRATQPIHVSNDQELLYLQLFAAIPANDTRSWCFTYRIVYPSGDIKWLGAFGQNGSLLFEDTSSSPVTLQGECEWTFDQSINASVLELKQPVDRLDIAKVADLASYRVWALGKEGFISSQKNASLLFFVPRSPRRSINRKPTCVLIASPGAFMTVSTDGSITVIGTGTLFVRILAPQSDPEVFILQVLSQAKLDKWTVAATDAISKTVALIAPKACTPIKASIIPLWPSEDVARPFHFDLAALVGVLDSTATEEFSIFSPNNLHIHFFRNDAKSELHSRTISFEFDSSGSDFIMGRVYDLSTSETDSTNWKATILSPYRPAPEHLLSDELGTFTTSPPSSLLQPIRHLSHTSNESSDTAMSSVSSLPSDMGLSSPTLARSQGTQEPLLAAPNADRTFADPKRPQPPRLRHILTVFKTLYYSVSFFFKLFCKILWGRVPYVDDEKSQQEEPGIASIEDASPPDADNTTSIVGEHVPDVLSQTPDTNASGGGLDLKAMLPAESRSPKSNPDSALGSRNTSVNYPPSSGVLRLPARTGTEGDDVFYAELQSDAGNLSQRRTTAAIILLRTVRTAVPKTLDDDPVDATPAPSLNELVERAIQFLDGTAPGCTVSRCDAFHHGFSVAESGEAPVEKTCCLLEYQLDWEDVKRDLRVIRIASPSPVGPAA
ncbi:hypothetical protein B0H34DRAFT_684940 [Crassisporium funariophilum]|nr:hypothetical protein B0H34DRAFT_684940 [Crassisporium funariophilum]